jgi:hypothetical protein
MPSAPGFSVPIQPRCFHRANPSDPGACRELATWQRNQANGFPAGYYCDRHRATNDRPLGADLLIHRVQIIGEITIAGVDFAAAAAKTEALERIADAVAAVGGVFNLLDLSSTMARVPGQAPPGEAIDQGGQGSGRRVRH